MFKYMYKYMFKYIYKYMLFNKVNILTELR